MSQPSLAAEAEGCRDAHGEKHIQELIELADVAQCHDQNNRIYSEEIRCFVKVETDRIVAKYVQTSLNVCLVSLVGESLKFIG